ncbi:chromate transporter [Cytobacillus firmus]|uniref:Chromate transporter n=1 Tax=Cytobacillus firmus TaxID=1399 RepID=A0A380Y3X4_CYTFI|nr:chromate transporter [Cytobacillus firmus]KAF0825116.1 chromate transporter [Cytobacillus firmus]MBG9542319.1 chromate transporter [Cytobacillus firmus]MBG9548661.1 chromate transporter [Cytobacillus firmus]MBG9553548.1 chromate transporter [Cytobacillus firmus]MBG9557730.1 chromate transporter [Cytobacillus firmus]
MKQLDIFMAFFRVGILGYGGGPSSIPLVHKEVVDKYKWMDTDEFGDVLALGNALPGPIATKMAGYIGYRVGGFLGMVTALAAAMVPTIVLMIILLTALNTFKDQPWVAGMTKAVVPVVAVMLATLTWDFVKKSSKSSLGWGWTLLFVAVSLVLLEFVNIHPAIIIFVLLTAALLKKDKADKNEAKKERNLA